MKQLKIYFLILSLFTIIPACNFSQQNQSKSLVLETNQIQNDADKLNDLFNAFLRKQAQTKSISYEVRRIDSLVSGSVRDNTGTVTLQKNKNDSIVGLSFYGKLEDSDTEYFYVDNTLFKVDLKNKFYFIKDNYGKFALSTTCGQLVLNELIMTDTSCTNSSLINVDNNNFVYKTTISNESSVSSRQITIDKGTLVPNLITITKINKKQNWRQSITFIISNILINEQIADNRLENLYFKTAYATIRAATERKTDKLIGKKVPEIVLHTFENETINIRSLESNLVLLDFWELWCSPCIKSLPAVEEIANDYKSYGLITFGIIADTVKAAAHVKKNNITFRQVIGNDTLNSVLMVNSYPRYVLINRKGIIQNIYEGYSESIELDINSLLFE